MSRGRLNSLQVLRAVAALSVLELHAFNQWERASGGFTQDRFHLGGFGVDLFFVISGFIVTGAAQRAPSAMEFMRRRWLRVAPLYWLVSAPLLVIALIAGQADIEPRIIATIGFWPVHAGGVVYPLLGPGWTLCFEMVFYVSAGLAAAGGWRAGLVLGAAFVGMFALSQSGAGGVSDFLGNPILAEFLLGALIAARPLRGTRGAGITAILAAAMLLGLWVWVGLGPIHDGGRIFKPHLALLRLAMFGPPALLIVWGALQLEGLGWGLKTGTLTHIGDASYSIYLAHLPLIEGLGWVWKESGLPPVWIFPAGVCVGLAGGLALYHLAEHPLIVRLLRPAALAAAA